MSKGITRGGATSPSFGEIAPPIAQPRPLHCGLDPTSGRVRLLEVEREERVEVDRGWPAVPLTTILIVWALWIDHPCFHTTRRGCTVEL